MIKTGEEGDNGGEGESSSGEKKDDNDNNGDEGVPQCPPSPPHCKSKTGKRVVAGRYHPATELGKGAFSKVYSAVDSVTGSLVAIKKVETGCLSARDLERIRQELCLLKRLIHPNIVSLIDFEETSKNFNFVLEFIEGGSLHGIKTKFGNIPEPLLSLYMSQTLKGLHHLHSFNIVHRDIKGANILCTKSGECKLADFGSCSESLREDHKMTMIGTPYWMAPELIAQTGGGPASDIWSLGCTILELATGQPPYWKLNSNLALLRVVEDAHPPLPESTASSFLIDFLLNCFLKDPKMRYTAQELLQHEWIVRHATFPFQTPRNFENKPRSKTPPPATHSASIHLPKTPKRVDGKRSKKGLGFGKKKEKNRALEDDAVLDFGGDGGLYGLGLGLGDEGAMTGSSGSEPGGETPPLSPFSLLSPASPSFPSSSPASTPPLTFDSVGSSDLEKREPLEGLEIGRVNEGTWGAKEKEADSEKPGKAHKHGHGHGEIEPPSILSRVEAELQSELGSLKGDIDGWEKKLLELVQEKSDLETQNDELRTETELLLKKKETLEAKRDYLKDLIARQERGADLLDVDFSGILKRFQNEMAHTQRELEMSHIPKMSSVCWMGPGAICQCRDSATHKWDAAVITGNEISGSGLLFHVIFLGTGEKDQVRASDLQPPLESEENRRKKKTFFSSSKKKEKSSKHKE